MRIPYGPELVAALTTGALPEPGGLSDQDAPFTDSLVLLSAGIQRRLAEHG